jgi:hypothetical protein
VEIGIGGFDYEVRIVRRSIKVELAPSIRIRNCTAEGLVVIKALAERGQDWVGIKGIVFDLRSLNGSQVEQALPPLLELV